MMMLVSRRNDHEDGAFTAGKRHASPYATGGGGVVLEHVYGAVVLAALLRQGPVSGLGDEVTPVEVRFQQGASYSVDDVVVVGQCATGERRMFVGVRRNPTIRASSVQFVALLADYVRMVADHRAEFEVDRWRLALAVAAPHPAAQDVAMLAWHARKHHSHAEFRTAVNAPRAVQARLRQRLRTLDAAVEAAARHAERDELTWLLLRALHVIPIALEGDDPADRSRTVGELTQLVDGVAQANDLWRQLAELSAAYAQTAATVDRPLLLRDLSTRLDLGSPGGTDDPMSVVSDRRRRASVRRPTAIQVSAADPRRLGVHATIQVNGVDSDLPSYVERDVDAGTRGVRALLARAAKRGGFVLLVGGSSVGKTRCAYEAVRTMLPDWWLVHPSGPDDIAALAAEPPHRTVLWLDEIQRYFGEHGLTGGVMREWLNAATPVVIVGTMWPDRYFRYIEEPTHDGADLHSHERKVMKLADVVVVPEAFSVAEQRRARTAAATDRLLATALESADYGLTQTLAAAPQVMRHWEIAKTVYPYAWAVLLAAVDIRLLGAEHPLPEALLRSAAPGYCTDRQRAEAPGDWFEQGMAHATRKLHGATAALRAVGGAGMGQTVGYVIADYLVQHVSPTRAAEPIPPSAWEAVLAHLTDVDDLVQVAESASARLLYRYAVPLYRRAADAGNRYAADQWVVHTGDPAGIADLRARAEDHGEAAKRLAEALARLGDLNQLHAMFWPSPTGWDPISQELARALNACGEFDELRTLADYGDHAAAQRLADVLAMRDNADELRARARAESSIILPTVEDDDTPSHDERRQTAARERLADYLAHRNDLEELAARTDAPAIRRLFTVLRHRGDVTGMQRLADMHRGEIEEDLVQVLVHRGDLAELLSLAARADEMLLDRIARVFVHRGAIDQLETLTQYHWPAMNRLAELLADRGDIAKLRQLATHDGWAAHTLVHVYISRADVPALRAFESEISNMGWNAARVGTHEATQTLNDLLVDRGDIDQLTTRAQHGDGDAARKLAHVLGDRGDDTGAWRVLHEAGEVRRWPVSSIHDELVVDLDELRVRADEGDGVAAARLATALVRRGDLDQLRVRAGDGDSSAAWRLAEALVHRGDLEGLRTLADDGHWPAADHLANVLAYRGRVDELTIRADSGDDRANERLLDLLVHRGDLDTLRRRTNADDITTVQRWNDMVTDRGDIDLLRDLVDYYYSDRKAHRPSNYYIAAAKLANILVDLDELDELHTRADRHESDSARRLANLLADRNELDELEGRANAGDPYAQTTLADVLVDRRAVAELRTRTREHRDDFQAPERLVRLLIAQGDLAEAHHILLAQAKNGDHRAARQLPGLLVWLGRHDEARQLARYGLNSDGSPAPPTDEMSP